MYIDVLKLEEELDEFLHDFGYQVIDLHAGGHARQQLVRLFIERVDGNPVTVGDCSLMASQVQLFLEARGLYGANTVLEVSSGGLDRVLKRNRDLERYLGSQVKVTFHEEGKKQTLAGELTSFNDEALVLTITGAQGVQQALNIARRNVERVCLVPQVEF